MSWWKIALIVTVVWFLLVLGTGYVHVDVTLAGQLTDAQEKALSEQYGFVAGIGIGLIWGIAAAARFLTPLFAASPGLGIDQGFCLSWWHLSPRRKFIRELWAGGLMMALFVAAQASGFFPSHLGQIGIPNPVAFGWILVGAALAIWVGGVLFQYCRWKRLEARETPTAGPTS